MKFSRKPPRVREDLGYPPLVTPMSQMVGVQATANVLAGERYKNISKEVKNYIKGEYGKAPRQDKRGAAEEGSRRREADNLPLCGPAWSPVSPAAREYLGDRATCDEDVLSYIAFPTQAEAVLSTSATRERRTLSNIR